jgi:hypothetical protein
MANDFVAELPRIGSGGPVQIIPRTRIEYQPDSGKFLRIEEPAAFAAPFGVRKIR